MHKYGYFPLKLLILVHKPDKAALMKLLLHRFTDVRVETGLAKHAERVQTRRGEKGVSPASIV